MEKCARFHGGKDDRSSAHFEFEVKQFELFAEQLVTSFFNYPSSLSDKLMGTREKPKPYSRDRIIETVDTTELVNFIDGLMCFGAWPLDSLSEQKHKDRSSKLELMNLDSNWQKASECGAACTKVHIMGAADEKKERIRFENINVLNGDLLKKIKSAFADAKIELINSSINLLIAVCLIYDGDEAKNDKLSSSSSTAPSYSQVASSQSSPSNKRKSEHSDQSGGRGGRGSRGGRGDRGGRSGGRGGQGGGRGSTPANKKNKNNA